MMFDMQTFFYGLCGFLAALSISHPNFYIKHGRTVVALAWGNGAVLVVVTFMVLQVAEDAGSYRIYIIDYSRKLIEFLIKDLSATIMYMFVSELLNENLIWLAKSLDKHNQRRSQYGCDART